MDEKMSEILMDCWRKKPGYYCFSQKILDNFNQQDYQSTLSKLFLEFFFTKCYNSPSPVLLEYLKSSLATNLIDSTIYFRVVFEYYLKNGFKKLFEKIHFFKPLFLDLYVIFIPNIIFTDDDYFFSQQKFLYKKKLTFQISENSNQIMEHPISLISNETRLNNIIKGIILILKFLEYFLERKKIVQNSDRMDVDDDEKDYLALQNNRLFNECYDTFFSLLSNERIKIFLLISKQDDEDSHNLIVELILKIHTLLNDKNNDNINFVDDDEKTKFLGKVKEKISINENHLGFNTTQLIPLLCYFIEDDFLSYNIAKTDPKILAEKFFLLIKQNGISIAEFYSSCLRTSILRINKLLKDLPKNKIFILLWKCFLYVKLCIILRELIEKMCADKNLFFTPQKNEICSELLEVLRTFRIQNVVIEKNFREIILENFVIYKVCTNEEVTAVFTGLKFISKNYGGDFQLTEASLNNFFFHEKFFHDFDTFFEKNLQNFSSFFLSKPQNIEIFHVYGILPVFLRKLLVTLNNISEQIQQEVSQNKSISITTNQFSNIFSMVYVILSRFKMPRDLRKFTRQIFFETLSVPKLSKWFYGLLINSDVVDSTIVANNFYNKIKTGNIDMNVNVDSLLVLYSAKTIITNGFNDFFNKNLEFNELLGVFKKYLAFGMFAQISFFFSFSKQTDLFLQTEIVKKASIEITSKLFQFVNENVKDYFPITLYVQKIFEIFGIKTKDPLDKQIKLSFRFPSLLLNQTFFGTNFHQNFLRNWETCTYEINEHFLLISMSRKLKMKEFFKVVYTKFMSLISRIQNKVLFSQVFGVVLNETMKKYLFEFVPMIFFKKKYEKIVNIEDLHHTIIMFFILQNNEKNSIRKFIQFVIDLLYYNQNKELQQFGIRLLKFISKYIIFDLDISKDISKVLLKFDAQSSGIHLFNFGNQLERENCLKYSNYLINKE